MIYEPFSIFATPDCNGRPLYQVTNQNVVCNPRLFRAREDAERALEEMRTAWMIRKRK